MFGFGKKKKEFNVIHFVGVRSNDIVLQLTNDKGTKKEFYLSINTIRNHLPKETQVKTVEVVRASIWHVLGIMPTTDRAKVISAYRKMAMVYHPDHGGTQESFQTLNNAKEKALAKCNK